MAETLNPKPCLLSGLDLRVSVFLEEEVGRSCNVGT